MNRRKQVAIPTRDNQRYFDLEAEPPRSKLLAFSFAHVTKKKNYNFSHFKSDARKENDARRGLDELMQEISRHTLLELRGRSKESFGGFERIPRARIHFHPSWNFPEDENVWIFRFKSSDYRMLCIKDKKREVLYIIGFDFDFSAYDHGS